MEALEDAMKSGNQLGPRTAASSHPVDRQIIDAIRGTSISDEVVKRLWDRDWIPDDALKDKFPVHTQSRPEDFGKLIAQTLRYETMTRREEAIPPNYESSYGWVFDRKPQIQDKKPLWSSIPDWLEGDSGKTYWITGKPGSGKSTMMKFIAHNPLLVRHLREWSRDIPLHMIHYYAWSPGKDLDKSKTGLMRSLLYQILSANPRLAPVLAPRRWALFHITRDCDGTPDWSDWELDESFTALLKHVDNNMRLMIFVDGLDEFDVPPTEIAALIHRITSRRAVKICIASRPWPEFHDAFLGCPGLEMHLLTYQDIKSFTSGQFAQSPGFLDLEKIYPRETNRLMDEIVTKSNGVFLWTALVMQSLLQLLVEGASLQQLDSTLQQMPSDIEKLYDAIHAKIPSRLLPELSVMLLIFKSARSPLPWFTMWVADELRGAELDVTMVNLDAREKALPLFRRRLTARTRGILEISPASHTIDYLHRTAAEWVNQPETWRQITSRSPLGFDPYLSLFAAESLLLCPGALTRASPPKHFWQGVARGLSYASLACCSSSDSEARLVADLDMFNERAQRGYEFIYGCNTKMLYWTSVITFRVTGITKNMFLYLTAQFSVAPYVRARISDLSIRSKLTGDMLADAVFGPYKADITSPLRREWEEIPIPPEKRLEVVGILVKNKVLVPMKLKVAILAEAAKGDEYFKQVATLMRLNPLRSSRAKSQGEKRGTTKGFFHKIFA